MTTPKTPAQRKALERKRKHEAGLKEVRGIWLTAEKHAAMRRYAERLMK